MRNCVFLLWFAIAPALAQEPVIFNPRLTKVADANLANPELVARYSAFCTALEGMCFDEVVYVSENASNDKHWLAQPETIRVSNGIFQDYWALEIADGPYRKSGLFVPGQYRYDRRTLKAEILANSGIALIGSIESPRFSDDRRFDAVRILSYNWLTNGVDHRFSYRPPYDPADYARRQSVPGSKPFETTVHRLPSDYPVVRVVREDDTNVVLASSQIAFRVIANQQYCEVIRDYGELILDKRRGFAPVSGKYRGGGTGFFQDAEFVVGRLEFLNSAWLPVEWNIRVYWQGAHRPEDSLDVHHRIDTRTIKILNSPLPIPLKEARAVGDRNTSKWEIRDVSLEYLSTRPVD